jgi:hypothetical protein
MHLKFNLQTKVHLEKEKSYINFSVSNELAFLLKKVLYLLRSNEPKIKESEMNQMIEVVNIV